jgi:hypothetical protein
VDYETQSFVSSIVLTPFVFVAIAWLFRSYLDFLQNRRASRNQHEFATRLLDKAGPSVELFDYLAKGPAVPSSETGTDRLGRPHGRIVRSLQTGVVLASLASGFLLLGGFVPNGSIPFTIVGGLGLSLGVGFLLAALVAYRLSAKWGLLDTSAPGNAGPVG